MKKKIIIIGAGPAGLSCAYNLLSENEQSYQVVLIEELDVVGGLSRTINGIDNGTDIGPHRFFSKNKDVLDLWKKILPMQSSPSSDDIYLNRKIEFDKEGVNPEIEDKVFLKRKRFSRIFFEKHFIDYPIKISLQTFLAMGCKKTFFAGMSYLKSCFAKLPENNLEAFMINRFGKVLYELFFETYTEKVWGVHPSKISKEWGSQRIKGLSVLTILKNALLSILLSNKKKETSLIDEYIYPKYGSSQFYESLAEEILNKGGNILYNTKVIGVKRDCQSGRIISLTIENINSGEISQIEADMFVSSMPIKDMILGMNDVPQNILDIAQNLQYRDFILVNFVLDKFNLKNNTNFPTINNIAPDSWIYLQDNGIKAGRLDIMNNFSPYIIKDFLKDIVINLEYFCNETDSIWKDTDENIINFAISELIKLNATEVSNIKKSSVYRIKKAYPSYFGSYEEFDKIKLFLNSISNLYCIGRNGQHKYNNMDHSILSGIVAGRVIQNNLDKEILWDVNTDSEYQEIKKAR